jgi:acyl-CoA dehydrogenase
MSEQTKTKPNDDFRAEVRAWMEENAPEGLRNLPPGARVVCGAGKKWDYTPDQRVWLDRMAAIGWTAPTWPVEYGGAGLTPAQSRIIDEEMTRLNVPRPVDNQGLWMLAPALLEFGSEEQKRAHLPKIANGEIRWAQGYSEPGAGSDLASIKTRGEQIGDELIVNGSKLWSSFAHESDWIFALVRTDPDAGKHAGISFVLMDMTTPGLTTSPYALISGHNHFAETHFENVRVPVANVVAGLGRGWGVARYLLTFERAMIGERNSSAFGKETLAEQAKRLLGDAMDQSLRQRVLEIELDAWAIDCWLERVRDQTKARTVSPVVSSALKVAGTEQAKRRSEVVMSLEGADGLAHGSPASGPWLGWPMSTIGGGTTEIQLNIIAKRELGLPGA